jgi:GTPase SAR1 family protein/3',5'-cyclic AMP phosphodiesterase CpdA
VARFSWLHLSDLHLGLRGSRLLLPEYREAFERDLRKLHRHSGPWQLVVITGDLTLSGTKREFELLNSTLKSLWEFFRSLGSNPVLLAVPGDHDVHWSAIHSSRESAWEGLVDFHQWFSSWRQTYASDVHFHEGLTPGDFTATLSSDGLKIGIVGLNTVFRNVREEKVQRFLNIDVSTVEESLYKQLQPWALEHDLVLLLTHNPPVLLKQGPMEQLRQKLAPPGRLFLHLCGSRLEEEWTNALQLSPNERVIKVPSLFSDRRNPLGRLGYAAGQLVLSVLSERLRFFPRTVSDIDGGIQIGPLPQLAGDESHTFPLDVLRGKSPAPSSEEPSRLPKVAPASSSNAQGPEARSPAPPRNPFQVQAQPAAPAALPPGVTLQGMVNSGHHLISSLTWTPSGDALGMGSVYGHIVYWKPGDSEVRWLAQTSSPAIVDLCFSPDGQLLASSSQQSMRVSRVDGTPVRTAKLPGTVLAWSSLGQLAVDSGTGILWVGDIGTLSQDEVKPLKLGVSPGNCLAWSPSGLILVWGGAGDSSLKVWRVNEGDSNQLIPVELRAAPRCVILDAAWNPQSSWVALAGRDTNIHIWDMGKAGTPVAMLEGHTDAVTRVSFSFDGRLLASRSYDGTVRLWRTDTWEQVAQLEEPASPESRGGLAFAPTRPVLATVAPNSKGIRLWHLDIDTLLQRQVPTSTVYEISAKVVLVGEGRAGKSCLAQRLVQDRYEEMESTHGMRFWSLPAGAPAAKAPPATARQEIILWDMGGQSEYQLVHQLFLRDSAVALMVMEPGRGERALDEVEGWNQRLLAQSGGRNIRKLLVGTKLDSVLSPEDRSAIEGLVRRCQFDGYVATSARTGQGIPALKEALAKAIDWSSIERISRPELFQRLRQQIQRLRESKRVVLTFVELESELRRELGSTFDAEMLQAVVGQLARQGLVADSRLADGTRVLILEIEQVERYAGSLIVAARDNPYGVPALDMARVMSPSMEFPRILPAERLRRDQELPVLDCVIDLLIEHGLCLRHEGLLIFPSLFRPTQSEPGGAESSHAISLHYDFSGPIDNIYASLITSLALSRRFGSMRLWQDRAEFGRAGEDSSGVRQVKEGNQAARGYARLDVYFDPGTPSATRELFVSFIEEHLSERGVELVERLAVTCVCGRGFAEDIVRDRLNLGRTDIRCPVCEQVTPLTVGARQARELNPQVVEQLRALRTDIRELRSQNKLETIVRMTEDKKMSVSQDTPLRVLHLSDLHVGGEDDPLSLFQPLAADLEDSQEGLGVERLDYLVISGDITQRASPVEFEKAHAFVSQVIERFGLTAERCIVVPGNHDLDWDTEAYTWTKKRQVDVGRLKPGTFIEAGDGYNVRDDVKYPQRFKNFAQHFYHPLTQKLYPLAPQEQCIPSLFSEHRLQFLAMNSAWEIDEYFRERSSIFEQALSRGLALAEQQRREVLGPQERVLRLAVWHHPITGNEKIQDTAFVERMLQADVRICMHGHVHEDRADLVNYLQPERKLYVVGAGSFGAPMHHRPESVPRLFNLLEVRRDLRRFRVHTRSLRKHGGAWGAWAVWPGDKPGEKRAYYDVALP